MVDEWGRVIFAADDAAELLMQGYDITEICIDPDPMIERYNRACLGHNKADYLIHTPAAPSTTSTEEAARRQADWWMPDAYRQLDVRSKLLALCQNREQIERVTMEMDLFEALNFLPVLRLLCFLVDHWRANGVVWGVGRGSSVASYCLYLIGVHRIDSLAYQLDISEFLR